MVKIMFLGLDHVLEEELEEYRRTASVRDMAHSGDPHTLIFDERRGMAISIIEYYRKYEPQTYETWRRLCKNDGLDPDKLEKLEDWPK